MKKPLLLVSSLAVLAGVFPAPAQAATETVSLSHVDTIPQSLGGTSKNTYDEAVIDLVKKAGAGSELYAGVYSLSIPAVADALIAYMERGGKLYLLTWRQNGGNQDEEGSLTSNQLIRLREYLKKHPKSGWFKDCIGGCRRDKTEGIQHVKYWAIKYADGRFAVMQGTGNSTPDTNGKAFNDFDRASGTRAMLPLFDQFKNYTVTSRKDKDLPDVKDVTVPLSDGTLTSRLFPNKKGYQVYSEIKAARGYKAKKGEQGCHIVRNQFKTTSKGNGLKEMREVSRIAQQGCWAEWNTNWKPNDQSKAFEKEVRAMISAGVIVWDMSWSPNPKYQGKHYGHGKWAAAVVKNSSGKITYWRVIGSATGSKSAETVSSEQEWLERSKSQALYGFSRQAQMRPYMRQFTYEQMCPIIKDSKGKPLKDKNGKYVRPDGCRR